VVVTACIGKDFATPTQATIQKHMDKPSVPTANQKRKNAVRAAAERSAVQSLFYVK